MKIRYLMLAAIASASLLTGCHWQSDSSTPDSGPVVPAQSAPTITTQPASSSVSASAGATFTVAGAGTPTPIVQWQRSNDSGSTWTDIAGATSPSYTLATTAGTDSGSEFRAVLTNGAGSVTSQAATLTVTVASLSTWQTPTALRPSDSTVDTWLPAKSVAADAHGGFVAVWGERTYPSNAAASFRSSRYTPGVGWSNPVLIDPDPNVFLAWIAVAPDGQAVVVYVKQTSGQAGVWASTQASGGAWSAPVLVQSDTAFIQGATDLQVVMDDSDNATAIWLRSDVYTHPQIWASRLPSGSAWSAPEIIAGGASDGANVPLGGGSLATNAFYMGSRIRLVANAVGNVVAGWSGTDTTNDYPAINVFRPGTGWSGLQILSVGNYLSDVAVNNDHVVVLASGYNGSTPYTLTARWKLADGTWADTQTVPCGTADPMIALAPDGALTATWTVLNPATQIFAAQQAASGGAWSASQIIETAFSIQGPVIPVKSDASGNVIAVWGESSGLSAGLQKVSALLPAGGAWGPVSPIAAADSNSTAIDGFALSGNGDAAVTWGQSVTSRYDNPYFPVANVFLH